METFLTTHNKVCKKNANGIGGCGHILLSTIKIWENWQNGKCWL